VRKASDLESRILTIYVAEDVFVTEYKIMFFISAKYQSIFSQDIVLVLHFYENHVF